MIDLYNLEMTQLNTLIRIMKGKFEISGLFLCGIEPVINFRDVLEKMLIGNHLPETFSISIFIFAQFKKGDIKLGYECAKVLGAAIQNSSTITNLILSILMLFY